MGILARLLRLLPLLSLTGVTALILLIGAAELALPMPTDQGLYSFMSESVRQGGVPYREYVDVKPPGIVYVRAAIQAIARPTWTGDCVPGPIVASCGWLTIKVADLVTTALFALALFATARACSLSRGAALTAAGLGATYVSLTYVSQLGLTPEKLAALLATLAVYLAVRAMQSQRAEPYWLGSGAALAAATLMKQPSATTLLPIWLLALFGCRRPCAVGARVGWLVAGGLTPYVVVLGYLAWTGVLPQFLEYTLQINFQRIELPGSVGGFGWDSSIRAAWQAFREGLAPFWILGWAGVAAALASRRPPLVILAVWALVDSLLLLRLREFIQLAPSVALLGGWALAEVWNAARIPPHFGLRSPVAARGLVVGLLASVVLLSSEFQGSVLMRALNERGPRGFALSPDERTAAMLRLLPDGPLYVWGNGAQLYLLTGRTPASRNLNIVGLSSLLPGASERRAYLLSELEGSRPRAIVVTPDVERSDEGLRIEDFSQLMALIQGEYVASDENRTLGGWRVYVRRG